MDAEQRKARLAMIDREIAAYRSHLTMALENNLQPLAEGYAQRLDSLQYERLSLTGSATLPL